MKKHNWMDIDSEKRRFVDLTSENTRIFNQLNQANDAKCEIMSNTIYDLIANHMSSNLMREQTTDEQKDNDFWGSEGWTSFKHQAEVLLGMLGVVSQDEIEKVLNKIKNAFLAVGSNAKDGEERINDGMRKFKTVDKYLKESGLQTLKPPLTTQKFINEFDVNEIQDIFRMFDFIINSKSSNLDLDSFNADSQNQDISLYDLLRQTYGVSGNLDWFNTEIMTKISRMTNHAKNGTSIGQMEVLLAILFKDFKLSSTNSDIEVDGGQIEYKGTTIEIKTNDFSPDDRGRITKDNEKEDIYAKCGYVIPKGMHRYVLSTEIDELKNKKQNEKYDKWVNIDYSHLMHNGLKKEANYMLDRASKMWFKYLSESNISYIWVAKPGSHSQPSREWVYRRMLSIKVPSSASELKSLF